MQAPAAAAAELHVRRQTFNTVLLMRIFKWLFAKSQPTPAADFKPLDQEAAPAADVKAPNQISAIERAIDQYHHETGPSFDRWSSARKAITSLAVNVDQAVLDKLTLLLDNPAVGKRALAAHALGVIKNAAAIPALLKRHNGPAPADFEETVGYDPDEQRVLNGIVSGKVLLEEERRIRDIAAIRCGHPFKQVSQTYSYKTLKDLFDEGLLDRATAVDAFVRLLCRDDVCDDRWLAERRLDEIDPNWPKSATAQTIVPDLLPLLEYAGKWHHKKDIGLSTATILGRIGDPRALAPLRARLNDCPDLAPMIAAIEAANR